WRMGDERVRAAALGALRLEWDWPLERVAEAAGEAPHGPGPLTEGERAALESPRALAYAPDAVRGDYPDWLDASMTRAFGAARAGHDPARRPRGRAQPAGPLAGACRPAEGAGGEDGRGVHRRAVLGLRLLAAAPGHQVAADAGDAGAAPGRPGPGAGRGRGLR